MKRGWRTVKTRFSADAFNGEGARLYGGRWNNPGVPMVYTAGSIALATLELLVHLDSTAALPLYSICSVDFDESLVEILNPAGLPANWHQSPSPLGLQMIGDNWISRGSSVVLQVPSAIVGDENNYLINPTHKDFAKLVLGQMKPFRLDSRLLRSAS